MTRKDQISLILGDKNLLPSKIRHRLLELFFNHTQPMSASEAKKILGNSAHLATVYRTLEKFVSVGILERVDLQDGVFRYEYPQVHHHHLVCDSCGQIQDFKNKSLEHMLTQIHSSAGFSISRHSLEFFGLCNNCKKGFKQ